MRDVISGVLLMVGLVILTGALVVVASCKSLPDLDGLQDIEDAWGDAEAMYEKARALFGNDEVGAEGWTQGPQKIDVGSLPNWRLKFKTKAPDMSRPNGEPERIWLTLIFNRYDYKLYAMIDKRDFMRHRVKGDKSVHVTGHILRPIPKGVTEWVAECVDGVLTLTANGVMLSGYPMNLPGAELEAAYWSVDAGRPAGVQVILGEAQGL